MNHIGLDHYETKKHGTDSLPFAVYLSRIPEKLSSYPMHWHEEMEFIYVESGRCRITIDGEKLTARKHDLLLISPGMLHAIDQVEDHAAVYYNVIFHPGMIMSKEEKDVLSVRYLAPLLRGEKIFTKRVSLDTASGQEIKAVVERFMTYREKEQEESLAFLVKSTILELLYHLRGHLKESDSKPMSLHQIRKMKELTVWLHETLTEEVALKDAAEFCGYSTSYFTKFFRNYTGSSFVSYRNLMRLEKAKRLLETGEYSGLEISAMCGFENYSYFIRSFRKQYDITPKQYQLHAEGCFL